MAIPTNAFCELECVCPEDVFPDEEPPVNIFRACIAAAEPMEEEDADWGSEEEPKNCWCDFTASGGGGGLVFGGFGWEI